VLIKVERVQGKLSGPRSLLGTLTFLPFYLPRASYSLHDLLYSWSWSRNDRSRLRRHSQRDDQVRPPSLSLLPSFSLPATSFPHCIFPPVLIRTVRRTKLIDDAKSSTPKYRGLVHGTVSIVKAEGISGVYRGLGPVMARQGANSAVRFTTYGTLKVRSFPSCFEQMLPLRMHTERVRRWGSATKSEQRLILFHFNSPSSLATLDREKPSLQA
jgi:hypothetical protein